MVGLREISRSSTGDRVGGMVGGAGGRVRTALMTVWRWGDWEAMYSWRSRDRVVAASGAIVLGGLVAWRRGGGRPRRLVRTWL